LILCETGLLFTGHESGYLEICNAFFLFLPYHVMSRT